MVWRRNSAMVHFMMILYPISVLWRSRRCNSNRALPTPFIGMHPLDVSCYRVYLTGCILWYLNLWFLNLCLWKPACHTQINQLIKQVSCADMIFADVSKDKWHTCASTTRIKCLIQMSSLLNILLLHTSTTANEFFIVLKGLFQLMLTYTPRHIWHKLNS